MIQGSNNPLRIHGFPESTSLIDKFVAVLVDLKGNELKKWSIDEINVIGDFSIELPLSEAETMAFPIGTALFSCKFCYGDGMNFQSKEEAIYIKESIIKYKLEDE